MSSSVSPLHNRVSHLTWFDDGGGTGAGFQREEREKRG